MGNSASAAMQAASAQNKFKKGFDDLAGGGKDDKPKGEDSEVQRQKEQMREDRDRANMNDFQRKKEERQKRKSSLKEQWEKSRKPT